MVLALIPMATAQGLSVGALVVSIVALALSAATTWRTHFAPMRLIVSAGDTTFRIADFANEGQRWHMAAFDMPIEFANTGARAGRVIAVRLRVNYPDVAPDAYEYMEVSAEVDPDKYRASAGNRLQWAQEAIVGGGVPFIVQARSSVFKHLVFDVRWEKPVIQRLNVVLEVHTDAGKRLECETWEMNLDAFVWNNRGIGVSPARAARWTQRINHREPADLHDYTGSADPVPHTAPIPPSFLSDPADNPPGDEHP